MSKPNKSTIIKKLIMTMSKIYDAYEDDRKIILNHPKILEYLFAKPITKRDNLIDAIKTTDNIFSSIILSKNHANEIQLLFISALKSIEQYRKLYIEYHKLTKTGSEIIFNKYIPFRIHSSTIFYRIMDILDELNICYIINWSFKRIDKYVNAALIKPYCFNLDIKIDFLGCVFVKTKDFLTQKMILFAIIYDNAKRFNKFDYLKEYYLRRMNIHLLRINSEMDLMLEIKKIIHKIKKNETYVLLNGLTIPHEIDVSSELKLFYQNYDYGHDIYMKYYDKKKYENIDVPDEPIDMNIYSDTPCDNSVKINQDLYKKLVGSKYFFTQ